jgi:hypothetical protein
MIMFTLGHKTLKFWLVRSDKGSIKAYVLNSKKYLH